MLGDVLREQLDRIPAETRDPDLEDELSAFVRLLARLAGVVSEARRETGRPVRVDGLDLVVAEAFDLGDRCEETPGYEAVHMTLLGLVSGMAASSPAGGDRARE